MPNQLVNESSLYLKQHSNNPVNWHPWGEAAWTTAREQDKPVIVSIGYSACHWCHVMERECFEDPYIAELMNTHFISIKVDREERPDIDQIYMEAVQMLHGHGGWPLNAFCLPNGQAFFGGTYFPPEDRGQGLIPWPQVLMRVADFYRRDREALEENAGNIIKNMLHGNTPQGATGEPIQNEALIEAAEGVLSQYDPEGGGFGNEPKFPPSMTLDFLLALRSTQTLEAQPALTQSIDQAVQHTLETMACGGFFDQVGGGFARYSVDRHWRLPHFEKMLYDNALLIDIYSKAWMRYRNPLYQAIVEESIDWLEREMKAPEGGFYASLDADSEGEEGKYYLWDLPELEAILGREDATAFATAYHINEKSYWIAGKANPALLRQGLEQRKSMAPLRTKLLAARQKRIPPGKDTKQLLSWNALLVRALAEAGFAFQKPEWIQLARNTVDWLWKTFQDKNGGFYTVCYPDGPRYAAYLDDYAYLAEALLAVASKMDTIDPGTAKPYLEKAKTLTARIIDQFSDPHEAGFYFVGNDHEPLAARKKAWFDNAQPSGNSSMVHVLTTLHTLTADPIYLRELTHLKKGYPGLAKQAPSAIAHALSAITQAAMGIAVVKAKDNCNLAELSAQLSKKPWRKTYFFKLNEASQGEGYQLCIGTECLPPQTKPEAIAAWL